MPSLHPWGVMPYSNIPKPDLHRTNVDVLRSDLGLLKSIAVDDGITTYIVQSAIKSLADYARANNLTYNPDGSSLRKLIAYIESTRFRVDAGAQVDKSAGARVGRRKA